MDRQSLRVGGTGEVPEFCYVGSRQADVAGGAFLMELLEDTLAAADQAPEAADDRLSSVMRSLEAELGIASTPAPAAEDSESTADGPVSDDDGGLEDMLSELSGSLAAEAPSLATALPLEYWEEVPPVMGSDMGGWYVDGEGVVAGYEFREPCYYTYGEGSAAVEQVYSPLCLWE